MKISASILTLLIVINFPLSDIAQNRTTDTSATCISFWKNKESKVYHIRHSKEKLSATKGNINSEATYEAHIKVTDSTAKGFTIEWLYKNFKVAGATDNSINSLNSILEGLKIVYKTDDVGIFTELVNWQAVRDYALSSYEKITAKAAENSEFAAALKQVKSIFQSKENIEALLIREVQLFHSPYGVEYTLTGLVTETELPNVTGGAPFPASITIKLEELNPKMDYCKVSLNQIVDKGKAGPIMATMLKKLAGTQKVDEDEIKKQVKDLEISDLNSYNYALSSGWVNNLVYKRIANVGISKQIETYEITLQK